MILSIGQTLRLSLEARRQSQEFQFRMKPGDKTSYPEQIKIHRVQILQKMPKQSPGQKARQSLALRMFFVERLP